MKNKYEWDFVQRKHICYNYIFFIIIVKILATNFMRF